MFLTLSLWDKHWVDRACGDHFYKRRYVLVLDDMAVGWWTAMELSSGFIQGAILGVRKNDLEACRLQRFVLATHCACMLAATLFFRPCGSFLANIFLIASKLGSFITALLIVVHAESGNDWTSNAADFVTAGFGFLSTIQSLVQLLLALVLARKPILSALRRLLQRKSRRLVDDNADPGLGDLDAMMILDETQMDDPLLLEGLHAEVAITDGPSTAIQINVAGSEEVEQAAEFMLDDILNNEPGPDGNDEGIEKTSFEVMTDEQLAVLSPDERRAYESFERKRLKMLKGIQRGFRGARRSGFSSAVHSNGSLTEAMIAPLPCVGDEEKVHAQHPSEAPEVAQEVEHFD